MWLLAVPIISLLVLSVGVVLILNRRTRRWYLWTGIALIALYILSLPIVLPLTVLTIIALTGGSFGP